MAVSMVLYKTLYDSNPVYVFSGVDSGKSADKVNDAIKAIADACEALEAGVTGPEGSIIFSGTVVTGTGTSISATVSGSRKDDYYLNTSTGNYYKASAPNTWDYLFTSKGANGFSPTVSIGTKSGGSQTITITDVNGSQSFTVVDGTNGVSPTVTASKSGGVTTITITDINGTQTTTISDGISGWTEGSLVDGSNTLSDGASLYSSTAMNGASITVGSSWAVGHTARVGINFASSSTFSYPSGWVCVGDDCAGGNFTFSQGSKYWLTIECKPDATWLFALKVPV